jgi:hypothetical protein
VAPFGAIFIESCFFDEINCALPSGPVGITDRGAKLTIFEPSLSDSISTLLEIGFIDIVFFIQST